MNNQEAIVVNLGKRFHERYAKNFAQWNSKMIKALDEGGGYDVPAIVLDDGGLCDTIGGELPVITALPEEKNVARAKTRTAKFKPIKTRYVVRIPWVAVEETHNNPEYFNEYFDSIVSQMINKYIKQYGPPDKIRYGDTFIDYVSPKGEVFRYDGSGDHLDLYFEGKWASNEKL